MVKVPTLFKFLNDPKIQFSVVKFLGFCHQFLIFRWWHPHFSWWKSPFFLVKIPHFAWSTPHFSSRGPWTASAAPGKWSRWAVRSLERLVDQADFGGFHPEKWWKDGEMHHPQVENGDFIWWFDGKWGFHQQVMERSEEIHHPQVRWGFDPFSGNHQVWWVNHLWMGHCP